VEAYQLVRMYTTDQNSEMPATKRKLVEAGIKLVRAQGYNATTVDDICAAAGVTKGGFFHYFKSKEELAKEAIVLFREEKRLAYEHAPFRQLSDPLDRVHGRLDFAKDSAGGAAALTKGCLIGVLAQELSFTHPEFRSAAQGSFLRMAEDLEKDIAEAKSLHAPTADFNPRDVALLYVSIIQGSMILAKASETNAVLMENIEQFRRYVKSLFGSSQRTARKTTRKSATRALAGSPG